METLPFIVDLPDVMEAGEKAIFRTHTGVGPVMIPVEQLRENLRSVSEGILTLLSDIRQVGQFDLQEVTLQVEVTAEAGVNLIGTASTGGKGAISLKFAKPR